MALEVVEISDAELRERLEAYNIEVPPITITTRKLLHRKLAKLDENNQDIIESEQRDGEEDSTDDEVSFRTIHTNFKDVSSPQEDTPMPGNKEMLRRRIHSEMSQTQDDPPTSLVTRTSHYVTSFFRFVFRLIITIVFLVCLLLLYSYIFKENKTIVDNGNQPPQTDSP